jgi:hypothetical protein
MEKEPGIAYILLVIGFFGIHQFYLEKKIAFLYPILSIISVMGISFFFGTIPYFYIYGKFVPYSLIIGIISLLCFIILIIRDAITLSGQTAKVNKEIEEYLLTFFVKMDNKIQGYFFYGESPEKQSGG